MLHRSSARLFAALTLAMGVSATGSSRPRAAAASNTPATAIQLAHDTPRERQTKQTLEQLLATYDLKKYTFTRTVVIEQGATNHAFPVLTLNAAFAASPDELLSTYVHEQLHWHLRDRGMN